MEQKTKSIVWDLPVRVFHWGIVVLMGGLWWTAEQGEMEWHQILAYVLAALLVMRWFWAAAGSQTAKFSDFIRSPKAVISYALNRSPSPTLGHNPLGGYMVLALMLMLTVQLVTGLFATDDIFTEGPLYAYVSSEQASWLTWLHKTNFTALQIFIAAHILAVILHQFKGDKLIQAMFSGKKLHDSALDSPKMKSAITAWVVLLIALGLLGYFLIWPIYQFM
ncbi:cytochrome B [Shewanella maritima]|uniref:Cytochrome B n=1 Tax=Shewanella maritima TaxID=2520507 RepID=A0A411PK49_9GAMM|nr:cytochrome b/b6 domain-containing protein [Shewanella maritima]QBF83937.1 cytochrome B [Shewanella maritima]